MIKKFFITALILISTVSLINAQASFGFSAGVNFQNITGKNISGNKLNNNLITGFNAGITVDNEVAPGYYLQPGVLFSTKGAKSGDGNATTRFSYIEVPFNFIYKPAFNKGKILLGFGPYIAFAISGKEKSQLGTRDVQFKSKLSLSDIPNTTKVYYKGFDAGANFLAGYELSNNFSVQLNAQLGLTNIYPEYQDLNTSASLKNTGFGISISYHLPQSKN